MGSESYPENVPKNLLLALSAVSTVHTGKSAE
jgi:hypothetical protein